jgi:hypothetical protein
VGAVGAVRAVEWLKLCMRAGGQVDKMKGNQAKIKISIMSRRQDTTAIYSGSRREGAKGRDNVGEPLGNVLVRYRMNESLHISMQGVV